MLLKHLSRNYKYDIRIIYLENEFQIRYLQTLMTIIQHDSLLLLIYFLNFLYFSWNIALHYFLEEVSKFHAKNLKSYIFLEHSRK